MAILEALFTQYYGAALIIWLVGMLWVIGMCFINIIEND